MVSHLLCLALSKYCYYGREKGNSWLLMATLAFLSEPFLPADLRCELGTGCFPPNASSSFVTAFFSMWWIQAGLQPRKGPNMCVYEWLQTGVFNRELWNVQKSPFEEYASPFSIASIGLQVWERVKWLLPVGETSMPALLPGTSQTNSGCRVGRGWVSCASVQEPQNSSLC